MTDFFNLFPYSTAIKELLSARALNGLLEPCGFYSAIWRQFLIIFPNHRQSSLKSNVWIHTLTQSREIFINKFKEKPQASSFFQTRPDFNELKTLIVSSLQSVTGSYKSCDLEKFYKMLYFLIPENADSRTKAAIISIVARLYYQFKCESRKKTDNSPFASLMDPNFLLHDVCLCAQNLFDKLLRTFLPCGTSNKDVYNQICAMLQIIQQPPIEQPSFDDIDGIRDLYTNLFVDITKRAEINTVWSIIFSQFPDCTILHYFYCYAFINSKLSIPKNALPMVTYGVQIGRKLRRLSDNPEKQELLKTSKRIDDLINLIKEKDCIKNREIIRNQLTTIMQIAKGTAHYEDLMPISCISDVLDDFNFQ